MSTVILSPPHSIIFLLDPTNEEADSPEYIDGELTAATESCISVGTRAEVDGDTEISLHAGSVVPLGLAKVFSGRIHAPGGKVVVSTSSLEEILELNVPVGQVEITIWTDDAYSPGRIVVNVVSANPA